MSGTITQAASPVVLPTVLSTTGLQPQDPVALRTQLDALAAASAAAHGWPGYVSTLPGSLIEDITSTDVSAVTLCDQARIETVNSLTPYGANAFVLNQLGLIYGVPLGKATNTSVSVVFTATSNGNPLAGYLIPIGFEVSDGTHQYTVQFGGATGATGQTQSLLCVASQTGSWSVPAATVTTTVTSYAAAVPAPFVLAVTNPFPGLQGADAETQQDYRAEVLQAGLAACQGSPAFLKTLLTRIDGVQPNRISVRLVQGSGYEVIVAGGDPYLIAGAIYQAMPDLSTVIGSTMLVESVTKANPGLVTTLLNHGYATGQVVTFAGIGGMTQLNTGTYTITVLSEKTFTIGVNTTGFTTFTSGGHVLPNLRNVTVQVYDFPDTYSITYVQPPQQIVNVVVTWNTSSPNFVPANVIDQQATTAIIGYINGLPIGQPINVFAMQHAIHDSISDVLQVALISQLDISVSINSVSTAPDAGTFLIFGDPESYMFADATTVAVAQAV